MKDDDKTPPADPAPWQLSAPTIVYQGAYMHVEQRHARTSSGVAVGGYDIVVNGDWAGIVAFTDDGRLVMERIYRPAIEAVVSELPAGRIDPEDADPATAALRELREETGYVAAQARVLGAFYPSTGRLRAQAVAVLAYGAQYAGPAEREPHEADMAVHLVTPLEALTHFAGEAHAGDGAGMHLAFALLAYRAVLADPAAPEPVRTAVRQALRAWFEDPSLTG